MATFDPVLVRQLKRAGIDASSGPTPEAWAKFVAAVNDHYRHLNEDRTLLTRSMELSTREMDDLRQRVEAQRDQLSAMVDAIGDALEVFSGIAQRELSTGEATFGLEDAKREFSVRLQRIFSRSAESETDQVSGVHMNLVHLADQLIRLLAQTAESAGLKKELEVARVVQSLLVPENDVIDRRGVQIAGHYEPASQCGGDWWGVYDLPGGGVLALIGDVTGHGIASAILTGAAKAACDLACTFTGGAISPSELLGMVNSAIYQTGRRQIMMTCAAALFDPTSSTLTVANAGHPFPYLVRAGEVRPITVSGQPLGAAPTSTFDAVTVAFAPGDLFVWYSDGVVEGEGPSGEPFSEKRLRAVCQRAGGRGARGARDDIVEALRSFTQGRAQIDDVTLVAASIS